MGNLIFPIQVLVCINIKVLNFLKPNEKSGEHKKQT